MTQHAMPKAGDVLAGKYRLEKVAGEGGMGVVYAAQHLVLKQRVAVKVLLPAAATSEHVVERFAREAQAAARIESEHVARVMDAGTTEAGAPFLVMEYLEGCDLEELLAVEGPLPLADVVDYLLQALEALAHAHAVGLVHRDIKPANLFLACRADGGNVIKMLDFGISKTTESRPEDRVLTGHAVLGSPVYMSPEQLRNAKDIDARADLWSLGVVAYELLCGKPPFDGDGVGEIFAAILEKDAEPLHTRNGRLAPELSAVIAKCLQRKPEDRWADAALLARALGPYGSGAHDPLIERAEQVLARAKMLKRLETPSELRRVVHGVSPRARALVRRRPIARWVGAAVAAVVIVVGVAAVAAVRSRTVPLAAIDPRGVVTVQVAIDPAIAPASAAPPAASGAAAEPVVMDLPVSPGPTGGAGAGRARAAKPGKPQRPKFLNSRE